MLCCIVVLCVLIAGHYRVAYCTLLYCAVRYSILYCTVPAHYYTVLYFVMFFAVFCTVLYCCVLYCTVLVNIYYLFKNSRKRRIILFSPFDSPAILFIYLFSIFLHGNNLILHFFIFSISSFVTLNCTILKLDYQTVIKHDDMRCEM